MMLIVIAISMTFDLFLLNNTNKVCCNTKSRLLCSHLP